MKKNLIELLSAVMLSAGVGASAAELKIETSARVSGVAVKKTDGSVTVSGTVARGRPASFAPGAHVHALLLNTQGRVVACQARSLSPSAPKRDAARGYRPPFSATFSPEQAAGAAQARVEYVAKPHGDCAADGERQPCS